MDPSIGVFGLGRIGMQVAKRLHQNQFNVIGWNRSESPRKEFEAFGGEVFGEISVVVTAMGEGPRVFWILLPHEVVADFINNQLMPHLNPGDIVIDGGNSFYKESIARAKQLAEKGIIFYDCGTSGGVWGLDKRFCAHGGRPKRAVGYY